MVVRPAQRQDLLSIGRVAYQALWRAYADLLRPSTITEVLHQDYSPSSLRRRLGAGKTLFVAVEEDDVLVCFADASIDSDCIHVDVVSSAPPEELSAASDLLTAIRGLAPSLPMTADVLLGNLEEERFYEAQGFVPGEAIHTRFVDEEVVERRWWRAPST